MLVAIVSCVLLLGILGVLSLLSINFSLKTFVGDEVATHGQEKHPVSNNLWICGNVLPYYSQVVISFLFFFLTKVNNHILGFSL